MEKRLDKNIEYVKIKGSDKIYTLIRDGKKESILEDKNIKLRISNNLINKVDISYLNRNSGTSNILLQNREIPNEIMLRHLTVYEAIDSLDKYINEASTSKKKVLKIIHGRHGTKIRDAVYEYLDSSPLVLKREQASVYDGDTGVTIVFLI